LAAAAAKLHPNFCPFSVFVFSTGLLLDAFTTSDASPDFLRTFAPFAGA